MFLLTQFPLEKMDTQFADDIFRCIFIDKKVCIFILISLIFVPRGPINIKSALVQVGA